MQYSNPQISTDFNIQTSNVQRLVIHVYSDKYGANIWMQPYREIFIILVNCKNVYYI